MFKKFFFLLLSFFMITTIFAYSSYAFDFSSVTKKIEGSSCKKIKDEKIVNGKVYVCVKIGKFSKWKFTKFANAGMYSDLYSQQTTPLLVKESFSIVPQGESNTLFVINQRFIPELGQSFMVDSPISVTDLVIKPQCVTRVPLEYYSGQNQDHSLESFVCDADSFQADVTVSFLKISPDFVGNPFTRRVSGMELVNRSVHYETVSTGSDLIFEFESPVNLSTGFYMVTFGFVLNDPLVNTIWFQGKEYSPAELASCVTNPSSDAYPSGAVYRGSPENSYTGLSDNFRGFSDLFELHQAKVNSCIVVGNFSPPVTAPGDLVLDVFFTRV